MKKSIRRRILYVMLGVLALTVLVVFGGLQYFRYTWFRETPITLTVEGDLHSIPFRWSSKQYGDYTEPHDAILIPVSVPGFSNRFFMQFDTGAPSSFLRSGTLKSMRERGCEVELTKQGERLLISEFELDIAGNRVLLESSEVVGSNATINWDEPAAVNVIGTLGSDLLNQLVCVIDFPAQRIHLHRDRPQQVEALGSFMPFEFKGRRVLLPVTIEGTNRHLIYDSGCSGFGVLTSKYFFERYSHADEEEINYNANRHGDPVPVHHKSCDRTMRLGGAELPIQRISYVNLYDGMQSALGRFTGLAGFMGMLGNKSLTECTLILDVKANEFFLFRGSFRVDETVESTEDAASNSPFVLPVVSSAIAFAKSDSTTIRAS